MNELISPETLTPAVLDVLTDYAQAGMAAAAAGAGAKLVGWLKQKGDALLGGLLDKFLKSPDENRRSLEEQLGQCLNDLPQNSLDELAALVKEIRPEVIFMAAPQSAVIDNSPGASITQVQSNKKP